ncbi:MAG: hypothetical protein ACYSUK_00215 [Planctomycetota bacterium]|jgi:hypothetical protein
MTEMIKRRIGESDGEALGRANAEIERLQADNECLRALPKRIEAEADRYMLEDGTPGELSNCWGWRDISETLRRKAREALEDRDE